jgi:hypothetical protein
MMKTKASQPFTMAKVVIAKLLSVKVSIPAKKAFSQAEKKIGRLFIGEYFKLGMPIKEVIKLLSLPPSIHSS